MKPYYDISQTTLQSGAEENYDFDAMLGKNFDTDKSKEEDEKRGEVLNSATSSKIDIAAVLNNVAQYAAKNNDQALADLATKKDVTKIVEYLAEKSATINREVDEKKKRNYRDILIALALKRLRVNVNYSDKLLKKAVDNLNPWYNRLSGTTMKLTRKAFHAIGSDFEDMIGIFFGINESVSDNTILWMLNQLGMSVEEYKNMPYDDEDSENQLNDVRESFVNVYKKLIKH